jgi:glycosyltransferase involved in cell wall biosynthesis
MLRIAFVACNKNAARFREDPAFIFRCENLGLALKALGHSVWQGHLSRLPWLERWDIVVFHRPRAGWRLSMLQAWLHRRGTLTVADVDDLVFDPGLASFSPGVANERIGLAATRRQFESHRQALAGFDSITVSTDPLQKHAERLVPGAQVLCLPNALHWSWLDKALPVSKGLPGKRIGYMPGTRSHDRDFALVSGALTRLLSRHPDLSLHITGPLEFSLNARPGQVVHQPKLPFDRYHQAFEDLDINLAPLESTPFTACKTAIKVMEAAWWNIPTVCSPLPDAQRYVGAGALLAYDVTGFETELERLVTDVHHYQTACRDLRARVLPLADIRTLATEWLAWCLDQPMKIAT